MNGFSDLIVELWGEDGHAGGDARLLIECSTRKAVEREAPPPSSRGSRR